MPSGILFFFISGTQSRRERVLACAGKENTWQTCQGIPHICNTALFIGREHMTNFAKVMSLIIHGINPAKEKMCIVGE
jgi:hypothetical protein